MGKRKRFRNKNKKHDAGYSQNHHSSADQNQHGQDNAFICNNYEHRSYPFKKIIAWVSGISISAAFLFGFNSRQFLRSEIFDVVKQEFPKLKLECYIPIVGEFTKLECKVKGKDE